LGGGGCVSRGWLPFQGVSPATDTAARRMCHALAVTTNMRNAAMAKGLDKKKEQKKKPAKTMKEKKAEKNEKKSARGFMPT
jgi:hypothetical protein